LVIFDVFAAQEKWGDLRALFANAELAENFSQKVVGQQFSGNLAKAILS
jgi:hypothetical protein